MGLLKDWEKRQIIFIGLAFWWVICWIGITFLVKIWIDLPNENPLIVMFGVVMMGGFLFFMINAMCIMIKGLYSQLRETKSK